MSLPGTPRPNAEGIQPRIQSFLNGVAGSLARAERPDLLTVLKEAAEARRSAAATVVVVGETGRGKSSLINALLDRPSLSPVGVDVTTGCTLVFHHSPEDRARVRMANGGEGGDAAGAFRAIDIDEIEDWATVDGNPGNEKGVHAVLVGVDTALLERITIVDTPGVGGLDAGHGAQAIEEASNADALIIVLDANAPVSGPELSFLADVAEKVDNVMVVITKTDIHAGWQVIADDDARKIAAKVPRLQGLAPVPVSPTRALKTGDRVKWGVAGLESRLTTEVARRTDVLRYANILRVAETCLAEVGRTLTDRHTALTRGGEALPALQAERARLEGMQADGKALMRDLDDEIRRLTLDRADGLNRGMRDLRLTYDERVAAVRGNEMEALPGQLLSDVTALADRLTGQARDQITAVAEQLIARIDDVTPALVSLDQLYSADLVDVVSLDSPRKRAANRVERLSTLISFSSGRSIGSVVASLPVFALGGLPFAVAGLGIGAAFAFHMHKGRADVGRQNEFRNWMREQTAEAERQLNNDFSRAMIDIGHELRTALNERIDTRRQQVAKAIQGCEAEMARERSARDRELQALEPRLQEVAELRRTSLGLRTEVLGLPVGGVGAA